MRDYVLWVLTLMMHDLLIIGTTVSNGLPLSACHTSATFNLYMSYHVYNYV